jgi:Uri superfamily endonuclease
VKGVYALVIQIESPISPRVGSLGRINLTEGTYVYLGSAQNGIEKRVKRHLKKDKRKFWHIDYLLENRNTRVVRVLFKETDKTQECKFAKEIATKNEPVRGFGCSDCKCGSHLFLIKDCTFLNEHMQTLL